MKSSRSKKTSNKQPPRTALDTPTTQRMLYLVRDEILHKVDSRFDKGEARFFGIEARFDKVDARFAEIDARFNSLEAKFDRMLIMLEEQNSRNKVVMDSLNSIYERQDRVEKYLIEKF